MPPASPANAPFQIDRFAFAVIALPICRYLSQLTMPSRMQFRRNGLLPAKTSVAAGHETAPRIWRRLVPLPILRHARFR